MIPFIPDFYKVKKDNKKEPLPLYVEEDLPYIIPQNPQEEEKPCVLIIEIA
jgi:hypothetical protein